MKRTGITHKSVLNHICENLEQKLNSPQCRAIKRHIDRCSDCTSYLNSLKKTVALYKRYPIPQRSKLSKKRLISFLQKGY